ncbi:MAG: ROK family protein [Firmicutes bacterium]|nr:ROK family protein [Bacillota bacterium]
MARLAIGIDIGGTKMAGGLVDPEGRIHYAQTVATPPQFDLLERDLFHLVERLLQAAPSGADVLGIGVAVPGVVDRHHGVAVSACNLPWRDFGIRELLESRYDIPTRIENDADAAALGIYRYASEAQGLENFVLMTIGTGVGGGIILNGKLHGGEWPLAGEVGHMIILPDGPQCNCGSKGCLETLASGTAIGRYALEKLRTEPRGHLRSILQETGKVTAFDVIVAAEKGDALAQEVLREVAWFLAIGMLNVHRMLSPEAIVVGGGVVKESEILLNYVKAALTDFAPDMCIRIVQIKGGSISGLRGAAAIVWEEIAKQ